MKVLISGGSGNIGKSVIGLLLKSGHEVVNLTTRKVFSGVNKPNLTHSYWNPTDGVIDHHMVDGTDAVIHLAGYSVSNRWTKLNRQKMISSRVDSARLLVRSLKDSGIQPHVFLTASASGYYSSSDQWQQEDSPAGIGFLSDLCREWEHASAEIESTHTRHVVMRIGVVLSREGGALEKMKPLFRFGLGAATGSGQQWMSWIHHDDLVRSIVHLAELKSSVGVYNLSTPNPVTNREFSKALASTLGRPLLLPPIPAFILRAIWGEMSSMLLASQRLRSDRLVNSGFKFQYPEINQALHSLTH